MVTKMDEKDFIRQYFGDRTFRTGDKVEFLRWRFSEEDSGQIQQGTILAIEPDVSYLNASARLLAAAVNIDGQKDKGSLELLMRTLAAFEEEAKKSAQYTLLIAEKDSAFITKVVSGTEIIRKVGNYEFRDPDMFFVEYPEALSSE